jgi:hypothetical protein
LIVDLIANSTDGFCSVIAFDATALGEPVSAEEQKEFLKINIPPEPVAAAPKKAKKVCWKRKDGEGKRK